MSHHETSLPAFVPIVVFVCCLQPYFRIWNRNTCNFNSVLEKMSSLFRSIEIKSFWLLRFLHDVFSNETERWNFIFFFACREDALPFCCAFLYWVLINLCSWVKSQIRHRNVICLPVNLSKHWVCYKGWSVWCREKGDIFWETVKVTTELLLREAGKKMKKGESRKHFVFHFFFLSPFLLALKRNDRTRQECMAFNRCLI